MVQPAGLILNIKLHVKTFYIFLYIFTAVSSCLAYKVGNFY